MLVKTLVASTAFIQQLVASSAFIENLGTQSLTIKNGGAIQSENYEQGKSGFKLNSAGYAEFQTGTFRGEIEVLTGTFKNISITGNSSFSGVISSGPLTLSQDGTDGYVMYGIAGEYYSTWGTRRVYPFNQNDTWISVSASLSYYGSTKVSRVKFKYYGTYMTLSYITTSGTTVEVTLGTSVKETLPDSFYFTTASPSSYTLKLTNLPTSEPSTTGMVWNDNGTLKVVS